MKYMDSYLSIFMIDVRNHYIARHGSMSSYIQVGLRTNNVKILSYRYIIPDNYPPPIVRLKPTMREDTNISTYRNIPTPENENRGSNIRPPTYTTEPQP